MLRVADGSFFNRDVNCIRKFFRKRFRYEARSWPTWKDVVAEDEDEEEEVGEAEASGSTSQIEGEASSSEHVKAEPGAGALGSEKKGRKRLDLEVEASGFGRTMQRELEDVSHHHLTLSFNQLLTSSI